MYCWSIASFLFFILIVIFIIAIILWIVVATKNVDETNPDDVQNFRRMRAWAFALSWIAVILALIIIILGAYGGVHSAHAYVAKHHHHHGKSCESGEGKAVHGEYLEHRETATSISY